MIVGNILQGKPRRLISLAPSDTLWQASDLLAKERIGALLVMSNEQMVGIISERDIVRAIAQKGGEALNKSVSEFMTRDVHSAVLGDTIDQVMAVMTAKRFRHVPVKDKGRVIGVISIGDVVKFKVEEAMAESESLRDYIARG